MRTSAPMNVVQIDTSDFNDPLLKSDNVISIYFFNELVKLSHSMADARTLFFVARRRANLQPEYLRLGKDNFEFL